MATRFPYVKFVAAGAQAAGTGAIFVPAPSGIAAGDLEFLAIECQYVGSLSTPSGWTLVKISDSGINTKLGVFCRISTGSTSDVSISDSGDHTLGIRFFLRNFNGSGKSMALPFAFIYNTTNNDSIGVSLPDYLTHVVTFNPAPSIVAILCAACAYDTATSQWIKYTNVDYAGDIVAVAATSSGDGGELGIVERRWTGLDHTIVQTDESRLLTGLSRSDSLTDVEISAVNSFIKSPDDQGHIEPHMVDITPVFSIQMTGERSFYLKVDVPPLQTSASFLFGGSKSSGGSVSISETVDATVEIDRLFGGRADFVVDFSFEISCSKGSTLSLALTAQPLLFLGCERTVFRDIEVLQALVALDEAGEKDSEFSFLAMSLEHVEAKIRTDSYRFARLLLYSTIKLVLEDSHGVFEYEDKRILSSRKDEAVIGFVAE